MEEKMFCTWGLANNKENIKITSANFEKVIEEIIAGARSWEMVYEDYYTPSVRELLIARDIGAMLDEIITVMMENGYDPYHSVKPLLEKYDYTYNNEMMEELKKDIDEQFQLYIPISLYEWC